MHLTISAKLHILIKTRQTQQGPVLEYFIGSRESFKNIVLIQLKNDFLYWTPKQLDTISPLQNSLLVYNSKIWNTS